MTKRVLIYRLGAIGDTLIALPAFRAVARAYGDAERRVLTLEGESGQTPPFSLLEGTELINGKITYPHRIYNFRTLLTLWRNIRAFDPDVLVYLSEIRWPYGKLRIWRDILFFRLCGIRKIIGAPIRRDLRQLRHDPESNLWEREGERLLRCLGPLWGEREIESADWSLPLAEEEMEVADAILAPLPDKGNFIAACVGAKFDYKDWGEENWGAALEGISQEAGSDLGLVLVGGVDEKGRSERIAGRWNGPVLNLCNPTDNPLRKTAAILRRAKMFIGSDGGIMHLAASQNVPCLAVFSARDLPGQWYPFGKGHKILYERTPCMGCKVWECTEHDKACLRAITPIDVIRAFRHLIDKQPKKASDDEPGEGP